MAAITPYTGVVPTRGQSQDVFDAAMSTFIAWWAAVAPEMNTAVTAMNFNATSDTSATSNVIGTGAKTFTVSASKSFLPGMTLVIADTAAPSTNALFATVTSYSGTTLVVDVVAVIGSGTKTAWTITQTLAAGAYALLAGSSAQNFSTNNLTAAGAVSGASVSATGNMSGANVTAAGRVVSQSGADIASAATVDLSTATGNTVTITGTTATSALTMLDGQHVILIAAGAWPLTYHATNLKLAYPVDLTLAAGDRLLAYKTGGVVHVTPLLLATNRPLVSNINTNVAGSTTFGTYTATGVSVTLTAGTWDIDYGGGAEIVITGTGYVAVNFALRISAAVQKYIEYVVGGGPLLGAAPLRQAWQINVAQGTTTTLTLDFTAIQYSGSNTISSLTASGSIAPLYIKATLRT